jgi:hypothetical protein
LEQIAELVIALARVVVEVKKMVEEMEIQVRLVVLLPQLFRLMLPLEHSLGVEAEVVEAVELDVEEHGAVEQAVTEVLHTVVEVAMEVVLILVRLSMLLLVTQEVKEVEAVVEEAAQVQMVTLLLE